MGKEKAVPVVTGQLMERDPSVERDYNARRDLAIAEFGEGLPWSVEHYASEIKQEVRRGCESFIRAGRLLLAAHACATHGEWGGMLSQIGIDAPQAGRMMEAARRLAKLGNDRNLIESAKSQSKLIELLSLPEAQFAELAGGETNGLTLDDVAKMGVRELRAAVREARGDLEAKDERAAAREREIERLQKELAKSRRNRAKATPDETAEELRAKCNGAALQVRADIAARGEDVDSLYERVKELIEHGREHGVDHSVYVAGLCAEIERSLAAVREEFGIDATVSAGEEPEWMKDAREAGELA